MLHIAVIVGSTRPGRKGPDIAAWALRHARARGDATYTLVDLADHPLPHCDEPVPPLMGDYRRPHTRAWAETVAPYDGFVFVTPEYNHSVPAVLKNALDYLYAEWNDKAAGFVGYGVDGGVRAVEHLRVVAGELRMADVRTQVPVTLGTDLTEDGEPGDHRLLPLHAMLDQLVTWAGALRPLRTTAGTTDGTEAEVA